MKKLFIAALFCLIGTTVFGGEIAKGYIYEDTNGNGKKDRNEVGIASIAVSNGSDIVLTDGKGYYEISVEDGNTVFVIKPSGYAFPTDENNLPRYYYIHKPTGSPEHYKFKGVTPTGKLPRSLDFALVRSPEPDHFTALIFGDPQVRNRTMLGFYERKIVSELVESKGVAFGVSMGDVSDEDLDLMGPIKQVTGKIGVPWYYVNGNHDTNYDADTDILSNETFIKYFGPPDYSFNYGKAHMLVIDNIYFPNPERPDERRWASMSGLRDDQRKFIRNDLALVDKNKLVVLMMHVPLNDPWNLANDVRSFLLEQLAKFDNVLVISAHNHTQSHAYYDKKDGWNNPKPLHEFIVGTTCGSWYSGFTDENGIPESMMPDGTPQGYAYLRVNETRYELDYKVAGKPASYQMGIMNPKVVIKDRHTPLFITVNFFMGYKDDKVEFRIDDGEWQPMKHTVMLDPEYQNMYYRWYQRETIPTTRCPGEAVPSTHIWRASVPAKGIPTGRHKIEVRAVTSSGQTFYGESSYLVADPPNNDFP